MAVPPALTTTHVGGETILAATVNELATAANGATPYIPAASPAPFSVGPFPHDDNGWIRDIIGTSSPAKVGIPRAPKLTTMAVAHQLDLPASLVGLPERTDLQTQISATASGGVCRLQPGIYRQSVTVTTPMTLIGRGLVSIRGSDDWSPGGSGGCTWTSANGGFRSSIAVPAMAVDPDTVATLNNFVAARREMVFVDGVAYQIQDLDSASGTGPSAGRWKFVNTSSDRHVVLPINPAGHLIEVVTRQGWMNISSADVVLDGIDFRHAPTGASSGNPLQNSSTTTFTILNCMIGWCHGTGTGLGGATGYYVENTIGHNCGTAAFIAPDMVNPVFKGCVLFNNGLSFYGYDPTWGSSGIKLTGAGCFHPTFDSCVAFMNGNGGLWFDIFVTAGVMRDNVCWDQNANIFYEVSSFAWLDGNVLFRTPSYPNMTERSMGFYLSTSRQFRCSNNLVMHLPSCFEIRGTVRSEPPLGGTNGILVENNNVIGRNFMGDHPWGTPDTGLLWDDDATPPGSQLNVPTNICRNNRYGYPATENASHIMTIADDSRWHYQNSVGIWLTTIASLAALNSGSIHIGEGATFMSEGERIGHLRRFGLTP